MQLIAITLAAAGSLAMLAGSVPANAAVIVRDHVRHPHHLRHRRVIVVPRPRPYVYHRVPLHRRPGVHIGAPGVHVTIR